MPLLHAFVNAKTDSADTTITRPVDWNAAHLDQYSPMKYGAVGNGSTDDTVAVQAAFDAAYPLNAVFLDRFYLVGTINYKGQSIHGTAMDQAGLIGKPSQDVLHLDPTITQFNREGGLSWRDFKITVDDSVNASASFPQRGGVGNAGFAVDFANGAATRPLMTVIADISNVSFESDSLAVGGQNKSCGIYNQFSTFNSVRMRNVFFYRFVYGFWDDYPTSNLGSFELARDHGHFDSLYFNGCDHGWRMVNHANAQVTNLTMHSTNTGLELLGVVSSGRAGNYDLDFDTVMIEAGTVSLVTDNKAYDLLFNNLWIGGAAGETTVVLGFNRSKIDRFTIQTVSGTSPIISLTGYNNELTNGTINGNGSAAFQWDQIADTGYGNRVEISGYTSGAPLRDIASGTRDSRLAHARDALPMLAGHVSPMPANLSDLLINPRSIIPGGTEGTDYSRITDSTADFGQILRSLGTSANGYVDLPILTGTSWPLTKLRLYVKAKVATGGTQLWQVYLPGPDSIGAATLTWTTSYTVQSFDIDLTGKASGLVVEITWGAMSGGGAGPLDIAWIGARPWDANGLFASTIEVNAVSNGIILKSPDGTRYIAKIANGGTWTITAA